MKYVVSDIDEVAGFTCKGLLHLVSKKEAKYNNGESTDGRYVQSSESLILL